MLTPNDIEKLSLTSLAKVIEDRSPRVTAILKAAVDTGKISTRDVQKGDEYLVELKLAFAELESRVQAARENLAQMEALSNLLKP